ncbi:DUF6383 domain-containing protein [Parabacteroides sp. GYB001]|uniref:DUF6383 domain-containing protein n=1 Tax=Parabacteroides leei TaxID=2939491 RepID=UPI002016EEFB|nr:DUF6383 domain-containing protein [Parabacteroides leei]MCL3850664.1 DUF6383 domain-containing protein [Parabacteroides leei]
MNKKFSTLVAVLLAAGAWTTLDARVIEVTKPAVGQAVVIGSNLDGTGEGSVIYLNAEGYAAAVEKEVTAETATWELEAVPAVESKSGEVAVKYYLKTKNAKGEAVYLLQTQAVESKSGDSYTYSVGAKEDGVTPVEISIVEGRIQVMEGETTKNLKFGESAITAEEVQSKSGSTELTTVEFGVYSADDVFPGTGDVAVNEDGEVTDLNSFVENAAEATASFYLQVEGGYLYVDGGEVKVSEKVSATAAYSWTLDADKKMYSVALDRAKSDVKYLGVKAETKAATTSWTLVKAAAATEVTVADGALTVGTATISGVSVSAVAPTATNETITVGGQTLALQASFNNGEYYFISGSDANKAWKGEEDGTVSATTAVNADKCLWAVEDASANGVTRYKFKNKATGKYAMLNKSIEFVYTAAYNSGMYLSIANGANLDADLTNTTDAVSFGIYKSTTENVDAKELNDVLGNGFGLSILKVKDSKDKVEGMDAFDGKLTAIVPKGSEAKDVETFQLVNGDKYVALTLANEWGVENTGVNKRGGKFVLIDGKELAKNADKYLTYFTIKRYSGVADNLIDRVSVSDKATAATDTRNLYIMKLGEDLVLTSTVSTITGETYPYITLGLNNVASVKQFLGTFWNISFAATKSEVTEANEYKVGRAFAIEDNAPEYVSASSVEAGFPEAQWAVTAANLNTNAFTLANRETKAKIENVVLRETSEKNVYIVESVEANKNLAAGDKIKLTAYEDPTMFDGFMQATENALRNQKYYMGQYHAISGNKNVYFSENHQKSHQLGVVTDKNEATLWNLSFRMKDYDGGTKNAVDTVFVETVFATLIDGKIVTDPDNKKVEKSKLAILPYQFQNRSNNEYVVYNDGQGYKFYVLNPDKKKENAYSFALKKQPNGTYNIVQFKNADNENTTTDERHAFDSKIYVANSEVDGFGELRQMGTYATDNNSLMVVEKADAPEYHKIAVEWGDTISLYREENNAQVLYEKRDNKSVVEKDTLSFLNIDNINQFSVNPAIFADTAYINRTIDGEANTCYQYLLAVNVDKEKTHYCPYNPEHNTDEWLAANGGPCADAKEHKAVKGRFLVNLIDTANVYGATHLHNNPYVNEVEAGESRAKLSFVEGVHADDTLYITRKGGEIVKLAMDTTDFNVAKFAFRYVDNDAKTFKIQTQWKNYFPTEDAEIVEETANNDGYLKWINGTLVVENGFENGDVFGIEENVKRDPVANEDITTSSISVIAKEGAVIIKGAAGKKVTISNVLGQTIANTVLSSDDATISTPAGVVVVAVEGEAAVKAIVK